MLVQQLQHRPKGCFPSGLTAERDGADGGLYLLICYMTDFHVAPRNPLSSSTNLLHLL